MTGLEVCFEKKGDGFLSPLFIGSLFDGTCFGFLSSNVCRNKKIHLHNERIGKMKKRLFKLLAIMLCLCLVFTACSKAEPKEDLKENTKPKKVVLQKPVVKEAPKKEEPKPEVVILQGFGLHN